MFRWVSDAERNVPFVRGRVRSRTRVSPFERAGSDQVIGSGRDAFGRRTDELVTSEGWRNLQKMGLKEGYVSSHPVLRGRMNGLLI